MLDLDRFKAVNDNLGHLVGDKLLMAVAQRLTRTVRPADAVARFGGDEFCIVAEGIQDPREATALAERLLAELKAPFDLDGREVYLSASLGLAFYSQRDGAEVLRNADDALRRAKADGRNQYLVYDAQMRRYSAERMALEVDLLHAVDRGELELYYQPEIELKTGLLAGAEALVRWKHPVRGLLSPTSFIPMAEETGTILEIGRWVVTSACRQAKIWQSKYPDSGLVVSINLSARQIMTAGLIEEVAAILRESSVAPDGLKFEVTETLLLTDASAALERLSELSDLGVRLALDDFGTGYSSLSHVQSLTVNTLKIDCSFVAGIETDSRSRAIVSAVCTLAHGLGMDVTAEGVETAGQARFLQAVGCDRAQGFLIARPLRHDTMDTLLERYYSRQSAAEEPALLHQSTQNELPTAKAGIK